MINEKEWIKEAGLKPFEEFKREMHDAINGFEHLIAQINKITKEIKNDD